MQSKLSNNIFLWFLPVFVLALGGAILWIPKGELHLILSEPHSPIGDLFFRLYTQVGEWVPYVVVVALLFYKAGWSIFILLTILFSGLTTQIIKHIVDAPRPLNWFAEHMPNETLTLVEGVKMSLHHSFPSGHTTSFFALFMALSILIGELNCSKGTKGALQALCLLLAILGGYSRIYLHQHFAMDVLGGCIIGTAITTLLYWLIRGQMEQRWWKARIKPKNRR